MEPQKNHFLIRVDMSSVLKTQEDVFYTLLINPTEIATIYELKMWIQLLFSIASPITIHSNGGILHDFETIDLLSLFHGIVRVSLGGPQANVKQFLDFVRSYKSSHISSSIRMKLSIIAKRFETIKIQVGEGAEKLLHDDQSASDHPEAKHVMKSSRKDSRIETTLPSCFTKLSESDIEMDKIATCAEQEKTLPVPAEVETKTDKEVFCEDMKDNDSQSHSEESPVVQKPKRMKAFSIGEFLNDLREADLGANPMQIEEASEELRPKRQRSRRFRRHKSRKTPNVSPIEGNFDLPLPNLTHLPTSSTSKHIRFVDSVENDDSAYQSFHVTDTLTETSEKVSEDQSNMLNEKPDSPNLSKQPVDLHLLFSLKNSFGSPPVFVRN